jgi:titin
MVIGDTPLDIIWYKDTLKVIDSSTTKTLQLDEATVILSLGKLSKNDSGNYTCVAKNKAGMSSHTAVLKVKGSLNFITE